MDDAVKVGIKATTTNAGKVIRLARLMRPDGRTLVATVAHGLLRGPIPDEGRPIDLGPLATSLGIAGVDGIVVSPGFLQANAVYLAGRCAPAIVLCVDWTNQFRPTDGGLGFSEGRTTTVASVEDAARLGADAVMTYLFVGSDDPAVEAEEVRRNAAVSRRCEELGIVRIIETMARGARVPVDDERKAEYVALHCRMAYEIGCDLVKTEWTGDRESFAQVVDACPAPILVAGGPKSSTPSGAVGLAVDAIAAGAAGVVFGRNIVQAQDPVAVVRAVSAAIHGDQ